MSKSAAAFEDFVDASADELLRVACFITGDEAEAEDLVQECLIRIADRWPRVRRMEMPYPYARRALVNLALDGRARRRRRREELSGGSIPQGNGEPLHPHPNGGAGPSQYRGRRNVSPFRQIRADR